MKILIDKILYIMNINVSNNTIKIESKDKLFNIILSYTDQRILSEIKIYINNYYLYNTEEFKSFYSVAHTYQKFYIFNHINNDHLEIEKFYGKDTFRERFIEDKFIKCTSINNILQYFIISFYIKNMLKYLSKTYFLSGIKCTYINNIKNMNKYLNYKILHYI
jgi:hypothetical protein